MAHNRWCMRTPEVPSHPATAAASEAAATAAVLYGGVGDSGQTNS